MKRCAELSIVLYLEKFKNIQFEWSNEIQDSSDTLKLKLMYLPVLSLPDFEALVILKTNTSPVIIGAALLQKQMDGKSCTIID